MTKYLSNIQRDIAKALQQLSVSADSGNWDTAGWTRAVKECVGKIGESEHCTVYSSAHPDNGEWLWDMTWIREEGEMRYTREIVLVMESEWGDLGLISDDFQKLMLARAAERLMIYQAADETDAAKYKDQLLKHLSHYRDKMVGDRYLFAGWIQKTRSFWTDTHKV